MMKRLVLLLIIPVLMLSAGCSLFGHKPDALEIVRQEWDEFREHYGEDVLFQAGPFTVAEQVEVPAEAQDVQVSCPKTPLWERVETLDDLEPGKFFAEPGAIHFAAKDAGKKVFVAWRME